MLSQTFAGISVGTEEVGLTMTRLSKEGFWRLKGRKVSRFVERAASKWARRRENVVGEDWSSTYEWWWERRGVPS